MSEESGQNEDRDRRGRFAPGNAGGPGNPNAKKVAELRAALLRAVTTDDVTQVVAAVLKKAKTGDVVAAKELLLRLLGPPESVDLIERLEALEQRIEQLAAAKAQ